MQTKRFSVILQLLSYSLGQVILTCLVLAIIQTIGLVISVSLLIKTQSMNEENPWDNICVEAMLCLMFRFGPHHSQIGGTNTALTGQIIYSLLAISVNLLLVGGALWRRPMMFLPWLVVYGIAAVLGNLVLVIIVPLTILFRHSEMRDVYLVNMLWFVVPFLLLVGYSLLWILVFSVFRRLRREIQILIIVNT